jgi:hypothetical protein
MTIDHHPTAAPTESPGELVGDDYRARKTPAGSAPSR